MRVFFERSIFPAVLVGSLLLFHALLALGVAPGLAFLVFTTANIGCVALLEVAFPLRREWAWWSDPQSVNDVVHGGLNLVGARLGEVGLGALITVAAAALASGGGVWPSHWSLGAQVAVAVVLADFSDWGKHWAYHHVRWLWPIHALHHDVGRMHVLKGIRLHFLETTIRFAVINAPLLALGAPADVLLWYGALLQVIGSLNHSNVAMRLPRLADFAFATPDVHRLHHALEPELGRSNLAPLTLLPDHLFGTFRDPARHVLRGVGVPDSPIPASLIKQIAAPLYWARRTASAALCAAIIAGAPVSAQVADWPTTEGAPGGGRFSPLTGITRENVTRLRIAWSYRHGDFWEGSFPLRVNRGSAFESTPIVVDGRLFFTTPRNRVVALDPETGRELWTFDPKLERGRAYANMWINRGVAYWRDAANASGPCARRVLLATLDARLIELDAATGTPCAGFGDGGQIDLRAGIAPLYDDWEYNVTSPPTIVGDVAIVGSSIADTLRPDSPPGDVRAFDVRSGQLRWTFHTIPRRGEAGHETWESGVRLTGATNVWSTITADLARGLVFLPVSTPSPDFYGGDRLGDNLYSDSVVALDAVTGERRWYFQTVHHDLWDYDLAAPPVLVTLERDGKPVDAVAQATKHGFVFVLERETGKPLFPVEERPAPQSDLPGERTAPTQPIPLAPPPLVSQHLRDADLYAPTADHLAACRERLAGLRNDGLFTPPSLRGSIVYPFTAGGANWSGAAWDPARQLLVVPSQNLAHVVRLDEVAQSASGAGDVKPLHGFALRTAWWLLTGRGTGERYRLSPIHGRTLFQHDGVPCNRPPWGRLVGVDLARGTIAWSVSTSVADDDPGGISFGPALATASGLVFHGGTKRPVLRVHDAATGERIATFALPAGLHAGPMTYKLRPEGRQFLVVAPGGHVGLDSPLGDYVIAYSVADPGAASADRLGFPQLGDLAGAEAPVR